jgi:uncharacterized protein involved in response to NO
MQADTNKFQELLKIGFRPFFLGAGIFAVVSMALWAMIYLFQFKIEIVQISSLQWHAHEMIFGYAMAVVAGFLLTAVTNWTGLPTSTGNPLLVMFTCWSVARVLYLFGTRFLYLAGFFDILFNILLMIAIVRPIVKKRMWARMAVVSKLILLAVFNGVFLLGASGVLANGAYIGVYGGLFLIVGLILTVGKNLVPFFISRGVGYEVTIANFRWLDFTSLALFLLVFILELSSSMPTVSGTACLGIFLVNSVRLGQWHTKGIWSKPLLWGLYLSYCFICLGFLLLGLHHFIGVSKYLAIHSLAVGGIGLITLSMMSRVALGHTGRDISSPPNLISFALFLFFCCAVVRVLLPLLVPSMTLDWMRLSVGLWITAFLIYLFVYLPILLGPRVDK